MAATNTQKFTVIQNPVGCSCPQTSDVSSGAECWVVAAPECERADLKVSSCKSKHYLPSPYLFPVVPTQFNQNTEIIIYRPPHLYGISDIQKLLIVKLLAVYNEFGVTFEYCM